MSASTSGNCKWQVVYFHICMHSIKVNSAINISLWNVELHELDIVKRVVNVLNRMHNENTTDQVMQGIVLYVPGSFNELISEH